MKRLLPFILLLLLVSCTPAASPIPDTAPTVQPTATLLSFVPTFTLPTPSPTLTPVICDPFSVDFCITEGDFLLQRPVKPSANTFIDTSYAYASTANGQRDPHHGVEFINKFGTPVYAAGDGVVIYAGPDDDALYSPWPDFYGNVIVLRHENDLFTLYAHLSKISVAVDQDVLAGDLLGEVGQSGVAVGPHLHFEVRSGDVNDYFSTMNPELWLLPNKVASQPLGVIQISILDEQRQLVKFAKFTLENLATAQERKTFYGITYSADMRHGDENAVMGDMLPGSYRIAFKYNGQLYERRVEVQSGKLTQVVFVVK